jgi:hypothetical protein
MAIGMIRRNKAARSEITLAQVVGESKSSTTSAKEAIADGINGCLPNKRKYGEKEESEACLDIRYPMAM